MSLHIALSTTQIPDTASPHQEITAIIDLSQGRAIELLELMNDITARATTSSTIFRISSFEPSALIVPAYALPEFPPPNDFVILKQNFLVTAITPIKLIHANIMPHYLNWSATDENNLFTITTAELYAEVLKLVARGETLPAGATSAHVKNAMGSSSEFLISSKRNWIH